MVLRVDKEKGYIDLSKRQVSPEDVSKCEDRYNKAKAVNSVLRHVADLHVYPNNIASSYHGISRVYNPNPINLSTGACS